VDKFRRMNWEIRQHVDKIVGMLQRNSITRLEAERRLRDLMLNANTVARLVNRGDGGVEWK